MSDLSYRSSSKRDASSDGAVRPAGLEKRQKHSIAGEWLKEDLYSGFPCQASLWHLSLRAHHSDPGRLPLDLPQDVLVPSTVVYSHDQEESISFQEGAYSSNLGRYEGSMSGSRGATNASNFNQRATLGSLECHQGTTNGNDMDQTLRFHYLRQLQQQNQQAAFFDTRVHRPQAPMAVSPSTLSLNNVMAHYAAPTRVRQDNLLASMFEGHPIQQESPSMALSSAVMSHVRRLAGRHTHGASSTLPDPTRRMSNFPMQSQQFQPQFAGMHLINAQQNLQHGSVDQSFPSEAYKLFLQQGQMPTGMPQPLATPTVRSDTRAGPHNSVNQSQYQSMLRREMGRTMASAGPTPSQYLASQVRQAQLEDERRTLLNALLLEGLRASPGEIVSRLPPMDSGVPRRLTVCLARPEDSASLSRHQMFLREQIEVFQATAFDVNGHKRGRNKSIALGQVGVRCRHCAHLRTMNQQRGSVYFPSSVFGIYQAAQNMCSTHLQCGLCTEMPESVKSKFKDLLISKNSSSNAGRKYWALTAKSLGLVDTEIGIFFIRDVPEGLAIIDNENNVSNKSSK
jgi:hypothetical protein